MRLRQKQIYKMKNISLDITKAAQFLSEGAVKAYEPKVKAAQKALENGTCPGNDFLGWLHLPSSITPQFLDEVQAVANTLREKCEVIVVAGIGGSYLGARAVIEALTDSFDALRTGADRTHPVILYAGNQIGEDYLSELCDLLRGRDFGIINKTLVFFLPQFEADMALAPRITVQQAGKSDVAAAGFAASGFSAAARRTCSATITMMRHRRRSPERAKRYHASEIFSLNPVCHKLAT